MNEANSEPPSMSTQGLVLMNTYRVNLSEYCSVPQQNEPLQSTSQLLFQSRNGNQVHSFEFCTSSFEKRSQLRPIVQRRGGCLSSGGDYTKHAIRLVETGIRFIQQPDVDVFNMKFIEDCDKVDKLLDLRDYRVGESLFVDAFDPNLVMKGVVAWKDVERKSVAVSSDSDANSLFDEDDDHATVQLPRNTSKLMSKFYNSQDDAVILKSLFEYKGSDSLMGMRLWRTLESKGKLNGRSAHSANNRFRRTIFPNLKKYGLTAAQMKEITSWSEGSRLRCSTAGNTTVTSIRMRTSFLSSVSVAGPSPKKKKRNETNKASTRLLTRSSVSSSSEGETDNHSVNSRSLQRSPRKSSAANNNSVRLLAKSSEPQSSKRSGDNNRSGNSESLRRSSRKTSQTNNHSVRSLAKSTSSESSGRPNVNRLENSGSLRRSSRKSSETNNHSARPLSKSTSERIGNNNRLDNSVILRRSPRKTNRESVRLLGKGSSSERSGNSKRPGNSEILRRSPRQRSETDKGSDGLPDCSAASSHGWVRHLFSDTDSDTSSSEEDNTVQRCLPSPNLSPIRNGEQLRTSHPDSVIDLSDASSVNETDDQSSSSDSEGEAPNRQCRPAVQARTAKKKRSRPAVQARATKKKSTKGQPYSAEDDFKIICYLHKQCLVKEAGGNTVWKRMEFQEILPGRSFQSLKNRFLRNILPEIEKYRLKRDQLATFKRFKTTMAHRSTAGQKDRILKETRPAGRKAQKRKTTTTRREQPSTESETEANITRPGGAGGDRVLSTSESEIDVSIRELSREISNRVHSTSESENETTVRKPRGSPRKLYTEPTKETLLVLDFD